MDIIAMRARGAPRGQTLVEYALILAAIVFAGAAAGLIGHKGNELVNGVSAPLTQFAAPASGISESASGAPGLVLPARKKTSHEGEDGQ